MFLVRLIYASRVQGSLSPKDIESILEASRNNNARRQITGVLCFDSDCFLQCLEGSRRAVNQTYHAILNDTRHHDPLILKYEEISQRDFDQWTMGYMTATGTRGNLLLRYSAKGIFDPFEINGQSALDMLRAFREYL